MGFAPLLLHEHYQIHGMGNSHRRRPVRCHHPRIWQLLQPSV